MTIKEVFDELNVYKAMFTTPFYTEDEMKAFEAFNGLFDVIKQVFQLLTGASIWCALIAVGCVGMALKSLFWDHNVTEAFAYTLGFAYFAAFALVSIPWEIVATITRSISTLVTGVGAFFRYLTTNTIVILNANPVAAVFFEAPVVHRVVVNNAAPVVNNAAPVVNNAVPVVNNAAAIVGEAVIAAFASLAAFFEAPIVHPAVGNDAAGNHNTPGYADTYQSAGAVASQAVSFLTTPVNLALKSSESAMAVVSNLSLGIIRSPTGENTLSAVSSCVSNAVCVVPSIPAEITKFYTRLVATGYGFLCTARQNDEAAAAPPQPRADNT